ncbi:dolichol kinase [Rhodosporidiobolus nylandii]
MPSCKHKLHGLSATPATVVSAGAPVPSHLTCTDTGASRVGYGGYSTSSDSESDTDAGGVERFRGVGVGEELLRGGGGGGGGLLADGRLSANWASWAGERGRGEQVLVQKRSLSPSALRGKGKGKADASGRSGGAGGHGLEKERSWASQLLDTLEGHHAHSSHSSHHSAKDRRRPSSPSMHSLPPSQRSSRSSPRPRHPSSLVASSQTAGRTSPSSPSPSGSRADSPPLTLDSLTPGSWNPFPLFHIRHHLTLEVVVLVSPLLFALYRLSPLSMVPTAIFPSIPTLPLSLLLLFALSIPFLALFRRPDSAFAPPFTDARGYRAPEQADDGVAAALVLPILLSAAVWWDTYSRADGLGGGVGLEGIKGMTEVWEAHGIHSSSLPASASAALHTPLAQARALFTARYELVLLTALNAAVLLVHLALAKTVLRIEWLPKSNTKRFFGFMGLATGVSAAVGVGMSLWNWFSGHPLPISPLESSTSTFIQQASFYIVSRLARRGFTLGELNTMTTAGNALCLEFWRLSRARWYYKRAAPFIPPTFRAATPVIAFQAVLIPGAFLSGFLLSPLLVLSRNIASRPSHRLKWPTERSRHRRLLALGVLFGLTIITLFFLGGWTSWQLSSSHNLREPWVWAIQYWWYGDSDGVEFWPSRAAALASGRREWWRSGRERGRGWRRIALTAYWATVISSAIGGWQTHLVRARRIRMRSAEKAKAAEAGASSSSSAGGAGEASTSSSAAKRLFGALPSRGHSGTGDLPPSSSPVSATFAAAAAAALAPKEDKSLQMHRVGAESARVEKAAHASLNMRRKFFHALAVLMFVPGIAVDPAFTSVSFSLAFTLFTFAEYARFFAVYPIGAPLHIFFSEFVDQKDAGPVILSHFYLLTGCAGGLWLEGSGINRFTGVLVLGVGDSMASIVGKLFGRTRWPGTPKTVEGTGAFILSVVLCAWFFRLIGIVEPFSLTRYFFATTLAALLEASSAQNDNLVIPIYMWSLVSLFSC